MEFPPHSGLAPLGEPPVRGRSGRAEPWRTVTPGQLLFDHHAHDLRGTRARTGSLTVHTLDTRVEDFITWANHEAAAAGWPVRSSRRIRTGGLVPNGSAGAWPGISPAAPGAWSRSRFSTVICGLL